jgi:3-methylcrotonyl-CoA carboxylase alpha subunit
MGYEFELGNETHSVHPGASATPRSAEPGAIHLDSTLQLSIDGRLVEAALQPGSEPGEHILRIDGREERVWVATRGDHHFVQLRGRAHRVHAINSLERARRAAEPSGGGERLRAPMPGVVVAVATAVGDEVEAGQLLMTIESMKLQTAITAPHSAIVAEICVSVGASFDQGAILVSLEGAEDAGTSQDPSRNVSRGTVPGGEAE